MESVLLSLILVTLLTALGAAAWVGRKLWGGLASFFEAEEGKASQFTEVIQGVSKAGAAILADTLMASMSGQKSGLARAIDGAEADIAEETLAGANPLLAAVIGASPGLRRRLRKSPLLGMALQQINLGGLFKAGKAPVEASGNGSGVRFTL